MSSNKSLAARLLTRALRTRPNAPVRKRVKPIGPVGGRIEELEDRVVPAFAEFVDPNPNPGNQFGQTVVPLSTGNVVVTSSRDDFNGTDTGAVYLFNGSTGALISTLRGSTANDQIGASGVTALTNGNYFVKSSQWDSGGTANVGAITWGSGTTGVSGVVSAANSMIGSSTDDFIGGFTYALPGGNAIFLNTSWSNGPVTNAGAVTWMSGTGPTAGVVSASNSLVGTTTDDIDANTVGTVLANGNYVIRTPFWDNGAQVNAGAVTWGSGASGVVGPIGPSISLVGSTAADNVGILSGVLALSNGNYVVGTRSWDNAGVVNAGAVTWGSGTTGVAGTISGSNSIVGTVMNQLVGDSVTALTNGNYVVSNVYWAGGGFANAGAVRWGNGSTGTFGTITAANSLTGSSTDDFVGAGVTPLTNGHYVVVSSQWNNGAVANVGAVTWANGASGGTVGLVSTANSLHGTTANDAVGGGGVIALNNGNYVVRSQDWDAPGLPAAGAVTWGSGGGGTVGAVSAANSLVGGSAGDNVGGGGVTALTNGNYVVASPSWTGPGALDGGAVTWGNGSAGTVGVVTAANSLVGSVNDAVGNGGVTALTNGNYVVRSNSWDNAGVANVGAVTWGSGGGGTVGPVSTSNSLHGTTANDAVGNSGLTALTNGHYVVRSNGWDNAGAGVVDARAITWGSGTGGTVGPVTTANSLYGATANDTIGSSGVTALANGNYVFGSPSWDGGLVDAGAMTWASGTGPTAGVVGAANSAVGTSSNANLQPVTSDATNDAIYARFVAETIGGRVRVGSQATGFGPPPTLTATLSLGVLTVADTAGAANTFSAAVSGGNLVLTDTSGERFTTTGTSTYTVPLASVTSLVIDASGGNDTLTIDLTGGNITVPITFNGGSQTSTPGDGLAVTGGTFATGTFAFTNANDGTIALTGNSLFSYTGLEPIVTTGATINDVIFTFNGGAETIALTDAAGAAMTIDSTLGESVTFANPSSSLTINAGTGDDLVNVTSVDPAFAAALVIDGGANTDTVTITPALTLTSLSVTAEAINLNGSTVTTSGDQTYTGPVVLGANTTINAGNASFGGTVNSGGVMASGHTIFGYNHFGTGGTGELGIGNQATGQPDWTFAGNAASYTVKNLAVLVHLTAGGGGSGGSTQVFANVPEASTYTLVYELAIPNAANFNTNAIPYSVNTSGSIVPGSFDRIAYYLELTSVAFGTQYAYASMSAFTPNAALIGVPSRGPNGAFPGNAAGAWQQLVSNMNVVSNVPGVVNGTGITTGNIEFWNANYAQANSIGVPNASGGTYDFGDQPVGSGGHSSMQVHNYGGDVSRTLTINASGTTTFSGAVGGTSPLASLTVNTATMTADAIATAAGVTVNTSGAASITGTVSGATSTLTKQGVGTLTLSAANTYGGATTVAAGVLEIRHSSALGSTAGGTSVTSGATLQLRNASGAVGVGAEALTLNGSGVGGVGALRNQVGTTNTYAGAITLGSAAEIQTDNRLVISGNIANGGFLLTVDGADQLDLNGVVSGAGGLTKTGSGALSLAGANTYDGVTTLSGSANVALFHNTALGSTLGGTVVGAASLSLTGGLTIGAEALTINGVGPTSFGALRSDGSTPNTYGGAITLGSAAKINSVTGGLFLTGLINNAGFLLTLDSFGSAPTTVNNAISGAGGLTKNGANTLTLSGANTYGGATTVNDGRLNVIGSVTSNVTVSGGVLGGSGTINSANTLTLNTGTVAPGTSPAILNSGSVAFTGGTFEVEVNGPAVGTQYDQLNVTGTVALGAGTTALSLPMPTFAAGNSYTIINNDLADNVTGFFTGLPEGAEVGTFGLVRVYITYAGGNGNDVQLLTTPTFNGTAGADTIILRQVSVGSGTYEIKLNTDPYAPLGAITTLTVNGHGGNDTFIIDAVNGNPFLTGGITYNGGAPTTGPGDQLQVIDGTYTTITHTLLTGSSGNIDFDGRVVSYTGLEPVLVNVGTVTDVVFNLPAATSTAVLEDDGVAANTLVRLRSTNGTFETTTFDNPTGSVTINRGNAADTLGVTAVADLTSSLTIGTGALPFQAVSVTGAVTLAATMDLAAFATQLAVTAAVSADAVTLDADTGAQVAGSFVGVDIAAGVTGTGAVSVVGRGGNAGGGLQHGVLVRGGASVSGATTTVTGTGGASAGGANFGVVVTGAGTTVTSAGGTVAVTGTGGGVGALGTHYGVAVEAGGTITSGGTGLVDVDGTGGAGSGGGSNGGVRVLNAGSTITSAGGNVDVTGLGAGPSGGTGVDVALGGTITAGGAGTVSVQGTGAASGGRGVVVSDGGSVTSAGGTVAVVGQGGAGGGNVNYGVFVTGTGATVTSGGGTVTVTGTGGGGSGSNNIGVLVAGAATVTGGGTVSVTGFGGAAGAGGNYGVNVSGAGSAITSAGGTVTVVGTGGGAGATNSNYGVLADAGGTITAGSTGAVSVSGTGGNGTGSSNIGVFVTGGTSGSITGAGTVGVAGVGGTGGASALNAGVRVDGTGTVSATGAGGLTVTGTRGNANAPGVLVQDAGTTVSAVGVATFNGLSASDVTVAANATANFGSLTASAGGATVTIFEDSPTAVNTVFASTINLTSAGAITDNNPGANNLSASAATLAAVGGIDLDTTLGTLVATTSAAGAILIDELDAVTLTNVSTADGNITITAGGAVTAVNVVDALDAAHVVSITTTAGNISVGNVSAAGDTVTLNAAAAIVELGPPDAGADITGGIINLTAVTGIGVAGTVEINTITTLNRGLTASVTGTGLINLADTAGGIRVRSATTANGSITITTVGDMIVETVTAGTASAVALSATVGGGILDDDVDTTRVTGGAVTLTAEAVIGTGATAVSEIDTDATSLTATGVQVFVGELDAITVTSVDAVAGSVLVVSGGTQTVTSVTASNTARLVTTVGDVLLGVVTAGTAVAVRAAGAITDNNGPAVNATAGSALLVAVTGIGSADPIDTVVGELSGSNSTSGAFNVVNTGSLSTLNASSSDLQASISATGVTNPGGSMAIVTGTAASNATLTVSTGTPVSAAGDVVLTSDGDYTQNAAVTSAGGSVTINADVVADADTTGATVAVNVNAPITAATTATINTGGDADTVTVRRTTASNLDVFGGGIVAPAVGFDQVTVVLGNLGAGFVRLNNSGSDNYHATVDGAAQGTALTFHANTLLNELNAALPGTASGVRRVSVNAATILDYNPAGATLTELSLLGGTAGDTYYVQFTDTASNALSLLPPLVNVTANGAADAAFVYGTNSPDTVGVNVGDNDRVTSAGVAVRYDGNLEALTVYGKGEMVQPGDTFAVRPDQQTAVTIHAGTPIIYPGDTLELDVIGLVGLNPTISDPALPDGNFSLNGYGLLTWTSIENFPVPRGLGGSFDFGTAASPVQFGFTQVLPGSSYPAASVAGTGWHGWATTPLYGNQAYHEANPPAAVAASPVAALLRDFAYGFQGDASDGVFRVDVAPMKPVQLTALVGIPVGGRDGLVVEWGVANAPTGLPTSWTAITPLGGLFLPGGEMTTVSRLLSATDVGNNLSLFVRFRDVSGEPHWSVSALDVRPTNPGTPTLLPAGLVAPLPVRREFSTDGVAPPVAEADYADQHAFAAVASDGMTIDYYRGKNAIPNSLVTITVTNGTVVDALFAGDTVLTGRVLNGDAAGYLKSFQVQADALGEFTFGVRRPTGTATSTVTVADATGFRAGAFTQAFALPTSRRIDFGPTPTPVAQDYGHDGVVGIGYAPFATATHTAASALGWAVGTPLPVAFVPGGTGASPVQRDGVFGGYAPSEFVLDMPGTNYVVTATLGDLAARRDDMFVEVLTAGGWVFAKGFNPATGAYDLDLNGLTSPTGVSPNAGQSLVRSFLASTVGGQLRVRFGNVTGNPYWSLSALEARPAQAMLTVTRTSAAPAADGTTVSTYEVTGAAPGTVLTVRTGLGAPAADASTTYDGFQVVMPPSGPATFGVTAPFAAGGATSSIEVEAVSGAERRVIAETYTAPPPPPTSTPAVRRFDFNGASNDTAPGLTGVRGNQLWALGTDGWLSAVGEFERAASTLPASMTAAQKALFRDGATLGGPTATFRVQVAAPGANYMVRYYVGDSYKKWPWIRLQVEGGAASGQLATNVNPYWSYVMGGKDDNNDGYLDVKVFGSATWVLNAIDVAQGTTASVLPPSLFAPSPQLAAFTVSNGTAPRLTDADLAPVVAEATRRWVDAGADPARLANVVFSIQDLNAVGRLGEHVPGSIHIDDDAGGKGWFVDLTPADDAEFGAAVAVGLGATDRAAARGVDLLTVVMHELGHELGLTDVTGSAAPADVMAESLSVGVRRLPTPPAPAPIATTDTKLEPPAPPTPAPVATTGNKIEPLVGVPVTLAETAEPVAARPTPALWLAKAETVYAPVVPVIAADDRVRVAVAPVERVRAGGARAAVAPALAATPAWPDADALLDLDGVYVG